MTDLALLLKRLALIEGYLADLRGVEDPAQVLDDVRLERFVLHTLQLAIQAALDVASHIVAEERLGAPATNRELFALLAAHGWIPREDMARLGEMAGFRNLIVHGYARIELARVVGVLQENLDDLSGFVEALRSRLAP